MFAQKHEFTDLCIKLNCMNLSKKICCVVSLCRTRQNKVMENLSHILSALSEIFVCYPTVVFSVASTILQYISELELYKCSNNLLRKLTVKVVQRIGLCFLKTRIATWR